MKISVGWDKDISHKGPEGTRTALGNASVDFLRVPLCPLWFLVLIFDGSVCDIVRMCDCDEEVSKSFASGS
jgi:hypothetical protein